jgi:hypothetical protein
VLDDLNVAVHPFQEPAVRTDVCRSKENTKHGDSELAESSMVWDLSHVNMAESSVKFSILKFKQKSFYFKCCHQSLDLDHSN